MRKKKWVRPFLDNEKEYLSDTLPVTDLPVYLEIGMGMGDFIVESAKQHPEIYWIGLEKDETCVARAIKKARDNELKNIVIMLVNADNLLDVFPLKSIDRIYLHFSDPWPKKAHHKRRLTYKTYLEKYAEILKESGDLVYKTDNHDFFEDSLEYFGESKFELVEIDRDYDSRKYGEPMTAYQQKFMELGQPIYFAKYQLK